MACPLEGLVRPLAQEIDYLLRDSQSRPRPSFYTPFPSPQGPELQINFH